MKNFIFLLIYIIVFLFNNFFDPYTFILLLIILLTLQLTLCFKNSKSFYFFLFPLISVFLSLAYQQDYTKIGDGVYYFRQANYIHDLLFTNNNYFNSSSLNLIFFDFRYIGAFPPIILIIEFFGSNVSENTFYLSQQLFFLFLTFILVKFNELLKILNHSHMFYVVLFLLISPSFFLQGVTPTRHFFTFFSVFMFYLAIESTLRKVNLISLVVLSLSVLFTFFSKPAYLFLYLVYFILRIFYNSSVNKFKYSFYVFLLFIPFYIYFIDFFNDNLLPSDDQLFNAGSTYKFTGLLGIIYKFIITSFGNFPWYDFSIHYNNFGGNILMFFMLIGSVFTWLIILTELLLKKNKMKFLKKNENNIILFGLIMSTSIFAGAAGHHGYLTIFFPFLIFICNKKSIRFLPLIVFACLILNGLHLIMF